MENSASIEETIASIRSYWRNGRCAEVAHVEILIAEIERLAQVEAKLAQAECIVAQKNLALAAAKQLLAKQSEPVAYFRQRGLPGGGHDWVQCSKDHPGAKALYTRPIPAAPAVPDGFKLVPIEPTEEMLSAGQVEFRSYSLRHMYGHPAVSAAMLADSPEQRGAG